MCKSWDSRRARPIHFFRQNTAEIGFGTDTSSAGPGAVGPVYEVGPTGLQLSKAALLRFKYDAAAIGGAASAMRVGTFTGGSWQALSLPIVDVERSTIAAMTGHFSVFGTVYFDCLPGPMECYEPHEVCVTGLAPDPVCAIPCRGPSDCPNPLYCIQGACALRGCFNQPAACTQSGHFCDEFLGYSNAPAEFHNNLCLPSCDDVANPDVCPSVSYMQCDKIACDWFSSCETDSACGAGELCYHGGILQWPSAVGECIAGPLGCACSDSGCPCAKPSDAGAGDTGGDAAIPCKSQSECPANLYCNSGYCYPGCTAGMGCTNDRCSTCTQDGGLSLSCCAQLCGDLQCVCTLDTSSNPPCVHWAPGACNQVPGAWFDPCLD